MTSREFINLMLKGKSVFGKAVKHSKNIIDLIEVGDYINGKEIIMDLKRSKDFYNSSNEFVTAINYTFEKDEIKTILTKEQYKQNCFRVKE